MTVLAVMTWLTLNGCELAGASGITANLVKESGLDPSSLSGSGIGLPQYAGVRRTRFLSTLGSRWRDGYAQLVYIKGEAIQLGIWSRICGNDEISPELAAAIWMHDFEKPRSRNARLRGSLARSIYQESIK